MTNEMKLKWFLDSIKVELIKSEDTIYKFEKHGYLVEGVDYDLFYTLNEEGKRQLIPASNAEELFKTLKDNQKEWWWIKRDWKIPTALINLEDMLPVNLDAVYKLQKTFHIIGVKSEDNGKIELTTDVSPEYGKQKICTVSIDYKQWAKRTDICVCESFETFSNFCDNLLSTEDKKAFIGLNLNNQSDDFEQDYKDSKSVVWKRHYEDCILSTLPYLRHKFIKENLDVLFNKLVEEAKRLGYNIARQ